MTLALRYAARSDRGLIRNNNQDSVYAGPRLLAVADGMGGHAAGEVASNVVINSLAFLDEDRRHDDLIGLLRDATDNANERLRQMVAEDHNLEGMGTTLTALLFVGSRVGLVHVGDSRAYLLRDGVLAQITHDDTFVQTLVDEGRITAEEASSHPQRSLILRALNGADVDPVVVIREARVGDRYLLCSDGLSGVVSADTIGEALQIPDPHTCADRLIELSMRSGAPDNVTVVVADVIDVPYGDDTPVVDGAAGGNRNQRDPDPNSPAGRAATLAGPRHSDENIPDEDGPTRKRRRPLRTGLFTLGVLVLLGAGVIGLWQWTQSQYFVGVRGDQVAVYQGLNTKLGPLQLYSLVNTSDLKVADLTQVARARVTAGIAAEDRSDADTILTNLRNQMLPECPPTSTLPTPTPTPTPSRTVGQPATPTPTTPSPTPTPSPTATPVPGEDCR